jgi:tripartite-type tricarboxylate transporter receptor subunit TctC
MITPNFVSAQSAYPNKLIKPIKPIKLIKLIIPLAAGSAVDNAARIVTQKGRHRRMGHGGRQRVAKTPAYVIADARKNPG